MWGRRFIIRTNHYTLKYMLDQRLSTVPQHQWISKLFGYDFTVEFRPGRLNIVADAFSQRESDAHVLGALPTPTFNLHAELQDDEHL